jgi:hypothetical protein
MIFRFFLLRLICIRGIKLRLTRLRLDAFSVGRVFGWTRFLLLGRTPLPPNSKKPIALEQLSYTPADISKQAIHRIVNQIGRLFGVA